MSSVNHDVHCMYSKKVQTTKVDFCTLKLKLIKSFITSRQNVAEVKRCFFRAQYPMNCRIIGDHAEQRVLQCTEQIVPGA